MKPATEGAVTYGKPSNEDKQLVLAAETSVLIASEGFISSTKTVTKVLVNEGEVEF